MERVSLRRAREMLAERGDRVGQPALSRYVAKYSDALDPQKDGRETTVDFEILALHRTQNINRAATAPSSSPASVSISKGRAHEASLNIQALNGRLRELDIAERIGALTPTREVRAAAAEAMSALRNAFALSLNDSAAALAHAFNIEPRLVRPYLKAFEKNGPRCVRSRSRCRRARAGAMLDVPHEEFTADLPGVADGRRILFDELARLAKPETELTVSEFADKYRVVSPESGSPFPGPWRTDRVPYLREPMDCLTPIIHRGG